MPVYVITGSNRGLGLEFVRQLSSPSNTVFAGVREPNDAKALKSLASKGSNLHILGCDTSSIPSIKSFSDQCASLLSKSGSKDGADKIDFVLNNAGINSVPDCTSLSMPPDAFHNQMTINVLGPAKLVEFLAPHLRSPGAVVMNMTSGLGSLERGRSLAKCPVYSISKAAVNMLTVQQAADLKSQGVRCICMNPGWVKTRMGGTGAVLEAEESIRKTLEVIHGLGEDDTAKFFNYTGEEMPW